MAVAANSKLMQTERKEPHRASAIIRATYAQKGEDTDVPRAKIVPCFPSGTLKSDEQQSTVAERPLLPALY